MDGVPRLLHDRGLFDAVLTHVRALDGSAREGTVFGYPAVFVGHHIVLCVYGSGIGIRLPSEYAQGLVDGGHAFPFQPYGRSVMREWIEMRVSREKLDEITPVLVEAIHFVRSVDDGG